MKVVVNRGHGGFGLSAEAIRWMAKRSCVKAKKAIDWDSVICGCWDSPEDEIAFRSSALLIKCVETLGRKANDRCSRMEIIEIPDGVEAVIEGCDGYEWIAEKHRTW